jgi:site-specific DNA-cytosine methylase
MRMNFNYLLTILDLCGGTASWSAPYLEAGYDVITVDLDSTSQDVRLFKKITGRKIYGILAAPPCCNFAASGARWWEEKGEKALLEGLSVVDACMRIITVHKPKFWALENPVGRLKDYLGKPKMYFNPCDYGDPYTKKTALWGEFNIPEKNEVEPVEGSKILKYGPSEDRKKLRSITPPGFARAFYEANK